MREAGRRSEKIYAPGTVCKRRADILSSVSHQRRSQWFYALYLLRVFGYDLTALYDTIPVALHLANTADVILVLRDDIIFFILT